MSVEKHILEVLYGLDTLDIISVSWISFNYIITCPVLVYSLLKFRSINPTDPMMKYRSKKLVYILNFLIIIILLLERLYANAVWVWSFSTIPINWIFYLIFSFCWWAAFFLFSIKVFHLYYKQQYSIAIKDMVWKSEINPNSSNWFIAHKHTYGKPIHIVRYLSIPFILFIATNAFVIWFIPQYINTTHIHQSILHFIQYSIALIPILFSLIIFYKSKKLKDIYFIRNEILYQCITIIAALFISLSIVIFFKLFSTIFKENSSRIEWLLQNIVSQIFVVGLALISTAYPVYIHSKYDTIIKTFATVHKHKGYDFQHNEYNKVDAIRHILSNYNSYKAFMQYLVLEFSTETLLFLTELILIKHAFQQENGSDIDMTYMKKKYNLCTDIKTTNHTIYSYLFDGVGTFGIQLHISSEIPKPIVIDGKNNLRAQMKYLYDKYVRNYCDHEINLSFNSKNLLYSIFEKNKEIDDFEIYNIFDNAGIEILHLLENPFRRFTQSELFDGEFFEGYEFQKKMKVHPKKNRLSFSPKLVPPSMTKVESKSEKENSTVTSPNTPLMFRNSYNDNINSSIYKLLVIESEKQRNSKSISHLEIMDNVTSMTSMSDSPI
eukprot:450056_1